MEAALCLAYGPAPSISLGMPSTTKLHFSFNPCSTSVSIGISCRRKCHHFYSTTGPLLALDRSNNSTPSANEKGWGNKVVRGAVGASLALACALSIIGCSCKMNYFKAIAGPKQMIHQKAPTPQLPMPPKKMALQSLLDVTVSLASKDGKRGRDVISMGTPVTDQLKKEAVSLIKSGQPDLALRRLESEHKNYELSDPETAYNMTLVLVEILICQGKYEKAYEYLREHDQFSEFDLRPTLYKAILCTMLDKEDEAQKSWEEFASSGGEIWPFGL